MRRSPVVGLLAVVLMIGGLSLARPADAARCVEHGEYAAIETGMSPAQVTRAVDGQQAVARRAQGRALTTEYEACGSWSHTGFLHVVFAHTDGGWLLTRKGAGRA